MSNKCGICKKNINKNQYTATFVYKGQPEIVHAICAKGATKAKKGTSHAVSRGASH